MIGDHWHYLLDCSMADLTTPRPSLCIASHNVQGINSPAKRRKILQYYHDQKIDILLLQEIHFPKSYSPSFSHPKFPRFYMANSDNKTKGVALFFSCNTQNVKTQKVDSYLLKVSLTTNSTLLYRTMHQIGGNLNFSSPFSYSEPTY